MSREFYHYTQWEDYKSGMYRNIEKADILNTVDKAKALLADSEALRTAMKRVTMEWPISTAQNLTNNEANSKAWLGQAACCIEVDVPEDLTRMAWNTLTQTEMKLANKVAEQIITEWTKQKSRTNGIQKDLFEL